MGYSKTDVWSNLPYSRNERICAPWETTYANTLFSTEESQTNAIDRRVKPADLIANMTSQAKQYTARNQIGSVLWASGQAKDYTCPSPQPYFKVRKWSYTNPGYQYAYDGSLPYDRDWATQLRLKIKDESINLGQTLAEYKQAASMFGNAARGVVNAWRTFRKKQPRRGLGPCTVPAAHLVYTYGVAPLVSDLYDSVEALVLRLDHPVRRRYFVRNKIQQSKEVASAHGNGPMTIYASIKQSQHVTAYIEFDLEKAALFNYGFGNPIELGWEVIPYSFVIDWMIPIGDYLASLDALRAVDTIRVARVEKVAYDHNAILEAQNYFGTWYNSYTYGCYPATRKYRSHERIVSHSIPLPALPKWSPSSSYKAAVNGLALLWQTFGQRTGACQFRKPRYLPGLGIHRVV